MTANFKIGQSFINRFNLLLCVTFVKLKSIVLFIVLSLHCFQPNSNTTQPEKLTLDRSKPIVINHSCVDLDLIPNKWIENAKINYKMYYGHTSHGSQLLVGMKRIENKQGSSYNVAYSNYHSNLPTKLNAFCILDWEATPGSFYSTCLRFLDSNPSINLAMFSWCSQGGYSNWQSYLKQYLSDMKALETAYPNVTFIYMTSNAQSKGIDGFRRYQFNQALREFCAENNKVLYDFADLDCWYNGEQNIYKYEGTMIPVEHEQYHAKEGDADYSCHTNLESCENKGKAVWWMLAKLSGW